MKSSSGVVKGGRRPPLNFKKNESEPARVLIHAPNWVGDHAMAFPFYAALRELFPDAALTLIGRSWVADLVPEGFESVIRLKDKNLPTADFHRIKDMHFDMAFTLSPSFRSAWLLHRLKIPLRYGFASDMRGLILTRSKNTFQRSEYNRTEHRALAYLRLLAPYLAAGTIAEDLWEKYRNVKLAVLPIAPLDKKFKLNRGAKYVVICPGSTAASKKYPVEQFIRAIEIISAKRPGTQFILLGAKIDQTECAVIDQYFSSSKTKVISLCAQTSLREAHTIIAWARVAIANDSGLSHITSLTGTALITFNGMGRSEETSPLTQRKTMFDLKLNCSPCFAKVCPRKDAPLACLTGISADAVAQQAEYHLV